MNTAGDEVQVLLATHNGARFLAEQVESILAQDYACLRILARDDGSTDGTRAILERYVETYPERFELLPMGVATGSAKGNFVLLLRSSTAPYLCCADQDDVWKADKVTRSMERMRGLELKYGRDIPLLIFSDLEVVNDKLERLHGSFWKHQGITPQNIHRFPRLLTQNVVTGCTALMNQPLAELASAVPRDSYMHDWWIALMACAFGQADYLNDATVLYRQHGRNVVGAVEHQKPNLVPRWRYHEKRREQWEWGERQAEAMLRVFGSRLPEEKAAILRDYVRCEQSRSRWTRVFTLLRGGFFLVGLRQNLAILWYLFDMDAAKRTDPRAGDGE